MPITIAETLDSLASFRLCATCTLYWLLQHVAKLHACSQVVSSVSHITIAMLGFSKTILVYARIYCLGGWVGSQAICMYRPAGTYVQLYNLCTTASKMAYTLSSNFYLREIQRPIAIHLSGFRSLGGPWPRGMTPLEISYACPEIKGNQDRNHWKSGNQASLQKSQFVTKSFLKYI